SDRKAECVMVGDTRFDMEGAAKAGLDTIGVLYGFGSRESLEQSGAKFIAPSPADVTQLLLK
ncbi:MAG: HAD hydrolase-like protein, partial [Treponema sp.]|nr:HAD hydrolase-like protein [Treponema sp.]